MSKKRERHGLTKAKIKIKIIIKVFFGVIHFVA